MTDSSEDKRSRIKSGRKLSRHRQPIQDFSATENNLNLINCLNIVNGQLNTRRTHDPEATHDQFLMLSKAYDSSQQKILELEQCLMSQTLLCQKQRSIIEILKQNLDETMDDETVLSFLCQLSRQTPNSSELCQTILSIRNILEKQRLGAYLKSSKINKLEESLKLMEQRYDLLKSEFVRIEETNRSYTTQIERISHKQQMNRTNSERQMQRLGKQTEKLQLSLQNKELQITRMNVIVKQLEAQLQKMSSELQKKVSEGQRMQYEVKQQQYQVRLQHDTEANKLKEECRDLQNKLKRLQIQQQSLRTKYVQEMNQKERTSQILLMLRQITGDKLTGMPTTQFVLSQTIVNDIRNQLQQKDKQIQKYRKKLALVKSRQLSSDTNKTEIHILKKFLSQEALKLISEWELNPKQYLEKEIVELSKLELEKRIKLEQSQKQLWKCKVRLLQYEEDDKEHTMTTRSRGRTETKICSQFKI